MAQHAAVHQDGRWFSSDMLTTLMSSHGLSYFLLTLAPSIRVTVSMPRTTQPNTLCLLSSHGVGTVVMKNCDLHNQTHSQQKAQGPARNTFSHAQARAQFRAHTQFTGSDIMCKTRGRTPHRAPCDAHPFVLGPPLAMLTMPGRSCLRLASNSSSNSPPQMDSPPVPSPLGSPADSSTSLACVQPLPVR